MRRQHLEDQCRPGCKIRFHHVTACAHQDRKPKKADLWWQDTIKMRLAPKMQTRWYRKRDRRPKLAVREFGPSLVLFAGPILGWRLAKQLLNPCFGRLRLPKCLWCWFLPRFSAVSPEIRLSCRCNVAPTHSTWLSLSQSPYHSPVS